MGSEKPLILVVDDSEDIRELFLLVLTGAGYEVIVAANGREGLDAVRARRPELIISDFSMPVMSGFDFLIHLRSDFTPPVPPVIVCSGFDVTAEEALRLGAMRFVAKPIEAGSLVSIVDQALRGVPAEASALERERAFVHAARARAAAAAARLFATLKEEAPHLESVLPLFVQAISEYFGFGHAAVLFVEGDDIRVAAVSSGSFVPAGTTFTGKLLFATGVLAAGSSLVVTNADIFSPSAEDSHARALGVKFLVAVPLFFDDVPVGAIALFDRATHSVDAEDLLILEGIGRIASQDLRHAPGSKNLGFVPAPLFERMLEAELCMLHRQRGGLEVLLVEMDPTAISSELALEIMHRHGPRLVLCRRQAGTVSVYKRDSNAVAARSAISASLSRLVETGTVRATGWVSVVDERLARVPSEIVLRLAGLALDQSRSTPAGHVERALIVGEATTDAAAAAGTPAPSQHA